jgi:hypothetical protein
MVHPEVKHPYHSIKVKYPVESEEITEMFIARFESDNKYHLLGYRTEKGSGYFPESSETNSDLGVVQIPKNKLTEMVKDEIFFVHREKEKPYPVKFISQSSN